MVEDALLVQQAQRGDLRAFEQLVRRHTPAVYRIAWRLLGQRADAEDVVQETWLAAWRHLPGFRGDAALSTWLYRLTTNQALNARRRPPPSMPLAETAAVCGSAEEGAQQSGRQAAVRAAVLRLPPTQRAPLVLREFEGLRYDEIAAMLEISVPAVKSRLHRARLELATMLREWR